MALLFSQIAVAAYACPAMGERAGAADVARLEPSGSGTRQVLDADLKANVPFIGGKIERAAAEPIEGAIEIETALLKEWLAR